MVHDHAALVAEHLDAIGVQAVREAYLFLTHHAATRDFDCRTQDKGVIEDFRYYHGTEVPFSFIVNQNSLLCYFRLAGLRHLSATLASRRERFDEVKENSKGEITVRIASLADAKRIAELVFGQ